MATPGNADRTQDGTAIAEVLLPLAIDHTYSYFVPPGVRISPGDFVAVPLGSKITNGVIWGPPRTESGSTNLKTIAGQHELSPLSANLRKFIDWIARWTLSPRGMVLRMAIGAPLHAGPEPPRSGVRPSGPAP